MDKQKVPKKLGHQDRRREILAIFRALGTTDVSITDLAKRFNVTRKTIYSDLDALKDQIQKIPVKDFTLKFDVMNSMVASKAREMLTSPNENIRLGALKLLSELTNKEVEFRQKLGLIEKPTDKLEIDILQKHIEDARALVKDGKSSSVSSRILPSDYRQ